MKKLFYKTVRSNGGSLWAHPEKDGRIYEIGKTYTFPKKYPAHVFDYDSIFGLKGAYEARPEASAGNRVLICLGEFEDREVPCYAISDLYKHGITKAEKGYGCPSSYYWRQCSTEFTVIGEIFVPQSMIQEEIDPEVFFK